MPYPKTKRFNGKIYKYEKTARTYSESDAREEAKALRKRTGWAVRVVLAANRMPALYVRK